MLGGGETIDLGAEMRHDGIDRVCGRDPSRGRSTPCRAHLAMSGGGMKGSRERAAGPAGRTALVAAWAVGTHPNFGVMLVNNDAGAYDRFSASERSGRQPWLEVCYLAP